MHKKDFFPSYCFHISRFQIIFPCRDIGPATATLDPRPRLWTRDRDIGPATATLDPRPRHWTRDPRLWTRDPRHWTRDPRPATISQTRSERMEQAICAHATITHYPFFFREKPWGRGCHAIFAKDKNKFVAIQKRNYF